MSKLLNRFIFPLLFSFFIYGLPQAGSAQNTALLNRWDRVIYPGDSLLVEFTDPVGCYFNLLICSNAKVSLMTPSCWDTIFMEPYSELTICFTGKTYLFMSHHCTLRIDTSFTHNYWWLRIDSLVYDPLGAVLIDTSMGWIIATTAIPGLDLNYSGFPAGASPCDEASINEHSQISLSLYPNPSDDILNIAVPEGKAAYYDLRIFDIYGQLLRAENRFLPGHINICDLPPAAYMIEASNGKERIYNRFVRM